MFDPSTSHVIGLSLSVDMTLSGRLSLLTILSLHVSQFNKKNTPHESHGTATFLNLRPKKEGGWIGTFLKHFLCCINAPPACDSSTVVLGTFVPFGDAGRECKMHGSGQSIVIIM